MAARGWGSTEVLAAFERAEELCHKIGDKSGCSRHFGAGRSIT